MSGKRLTDLTINAMKAGPTRREVPDPGARGLYLVVQPSGVKSFAVRYRFDGTPRKLTLKRGTSLAAARREAADALYEVEQGRDPSARKRAASEAQRDTFRAIAEEYMRREGGKLRTAKWIERTLQRLVYGPLGDRPIADIRRSELVRLLDRIEENNGPVMADRTLATMSPIFNWYATRSDDFRSPIVRGMKRTSTKERARTRVLSDAELRAVWQAAGKLGVFGGFVRFLLTTAARRAEAAKMTWAEIDGGDWILPADRSKNGDPLVRPLSQLALDVIGAQPRIEGCPYVFTALGKRPLNDYVKGKRKLDAASGTSGHTLHDLRRTARSLLSRAGVNADVAEMCLGHTLAGVRATYDRHSYHAEKKHALEALAAQIERIVSPPKGNVRALRA